MSFEIVAHAGRTEDFTVTIKTPAEDYVQLAVTDIVRFKASRGEETPLLDLDQTATANGSVVTVDERGDGSATHCSVRVRLAQGDTSGLLGSYEAEVAVVDDSETAPADAIKTAEKGVVHFIGSGAGDVGLT